MEIFEGFSQILKERSGEKKVLGCVYKHNSNNLNKRKRNEKVAISFSPVHMGPRLNLLRK